MYVLPTGGRAARVRFLPDGRLLVGWEDPAGSGILEVWSLPDGGRVRFASPTGIHWDSRISAAQSPDGATCYVAVGGPLRVFRTADGSSLPTLSDVPAGQVIASPDGSRLVTFVATGGTGEIRGLTADGRVVWRQELPRPYHELAGFLPDGERFITLGGRRVSVRSFATGDEVATAKYPSWHINHPLLPPDGRLLGVIGYHSMYVYDTAGLGRPRRISGSQSSGNFVSFAFHPHGRTLAVIHGGPTLVKLYDLDTLTLRHKLAWKVGPLRSVAFSPDGLLGAAGSEDGRVVVWDVDE